MKKIVLMMLVILGWSHAQAQRQPVLDYGLYSFETVRQTLVLGNTPKAKSWRTVLMANMNSQLRLAGSTLVLTESNFASYMTSAYVWEEERTWNPGEYQNSGWNPVTQRVEMFLSTAGFKGFVGVFHYGNISIVLYRNTCVNLIMVPFVPVPSPAQAPASNPMAKAAEKEKEEKVTFVMLSQSSSCNHGGTFVQRQPSNTMVMVNLSINAMGGGRYNYGTPAVVAPNRQWYPQSGGPVGVPGFPANTGGPWGVNGFPANVSSGVPWDANGFPATGGNPVSPYGFGTGSPVGIGGFPAQSNWD